MEELRKQNEILEKRNKNLEMVIIILHTHQDSKFQ
jgi:hypothetical protein